MRCAWACLVHVTNTHTPTDSPASQAHARCSGPPNPHARANNSASLRLYSHHLGTPSLSPPLSLLSGPLAAHSLARSRHHPPSDTPSSHLLVQPLVGWLFEHAERLVCTACV